MIKEIMCLSIILSILNIIPIMEAQSLPTSVLVNASTIISGANNSTSADNIKIIGIDSSAFPKVKASILINRPCALAGNLRKENFTIKEDENDVAIDSFNYTGDGLNQKLDLAIVFDDTDSMVEQITALQLKIEDLTEKIKVSRLDARYSLVTFKGDVSTTAEWTSDADSFKKAVHRLYPSRGRNNLPENSLGGIERALSFGFRRDAQKILIVVTDEPSCQKDDGTSMQLPSGSTYIMGEVKVDLGNSGVTLIAITPDFRDPNIDPNVPRFDLPKYADMRELAEKSGGIWININSADFSAILDEIKGIITGTYIIEYKSPISRNKPKRTLTVEIKPLCDDGKGRSLIQHQYIISSPASLADRPVMNMPFDVAVLSVAFSPDSSKLTTASQDSAAHIWDVVSGKELHRLPHDDIVVSLAVFSPNGSRLATASADNTSRIWDVASGKELQRLTHGWCVETLSFSPDGSKLATGSRDNTSRIWDVASGKELQRLEHGYWVESVSFSPDGTMLATASADLTVRIWEVSSGKELRKLTDEGRGDSVSFSPDGSMVAADCMGGAGIWDVASGDLLHKLAHDNSVYSVSFSPDGGMLATASEDNTSRIWDVASGKELHKLVHSGRVWAASFSPDGSKLATAGFNHPGHIWDVASGKELYKLNHSSKMVFAVSFSPDGRKVASSGYDPARIWDVASGEELQRLSQTNLW